MACQPHTPRATHSGDFSPRKFPLRVRKTQPIHTKLNFEKHYSIRQLIILNTQPVVSHCLRNRALTGQVWPPAQFRVGDLGWHQALLHGQCFLTSFGLLPAPLRGLAKFTAAGLGAWKSHRHLAGPAQVPGLPVPVPDTYLRAPQGTGPEESVQLSSQTGATASTQHSPNSLEDRGLAHKDDATVKPYTVT